MNVQYIQRKFCQISLKNDFNREVFLLYLYNEML